MSAQRKTKPESKVVPMTPKKVRESRPASDPEARERQLVSLAVDLAEKQLREGTASAAVMTHYLKMAGRRETLEREILEKQSRLMEAKASNLNKDDDQTKIAKEAIDALSTYKPSSS